ncbi:MAG: adenylate kinase [Bacilli bacterium]
MKNIIFLAPPAAGKGTLSELLMKKYDYKHISTGDLLREQIQNNTEIGKAAENLMKVGKFVSDDIIIDLILNKINKPGYDTGYILDGFPRTVTQALKYDELLSNIGRDIGVVIYLDVDKKELLKRVTGRMTCPKCNRIYNKYLQTKPKKEGICDDCALELTSRIDDNEETFYKRFNGFLEKTMPLYDYYKESGVLKTIKASENIEIVFEKLENAINGDNYD